MIQDTKSDTTTDTINPLNPNNVFSINITGISMIPCLEMDKNVERVAFPIDCKY